MNGDRTAERLRKSFSSQGTVHAMAGFNPERFATDMHPAAIHAREWGKRKPWYLIAKEREDERKRKLAEEAAKEDHSDESGEE